MCSVVGHETRRHRLERAGEKRFSSSVSTNHRGGVPARFFVAPTASACGTARRAQPRAQRARRLAGQRIVDHGADRGVLAVELPAAPAHASRTASVPGTFVAGVTFTADDRERDGRPLAEHVQESGITPSCSLPPDSPTNHASPSSIHVEVDDGPVLFLARRSREGAVRQNPSILHNAWTGGYESAAAERTYYAFSATAHHQTRCSTICPARRSCARPTTWRPLHPDHGDGGAVTGGSTST